MQRRKFITGLGALVTGSAAAMGTGAFTSVQANRSVSIAVADDSDAFLRIVQKDTPNGNEYVDTSGGTVSLDFSQTDDTTSNDASDEGSGVNKNATTVFDNLLKIQNQGSQGVYVGYGGDGSGATLANAGLALYHEDSDESNDGQLNIDTAPDNNSDGNPDLAYLEPGETLDNVGAFVFGDVDVSTIQNTPVKFRAVDDFEDL